MATFRRGLESAKAAATRSRGGKFTPTFNWEAGETKYLQFLTSMDDIPTVLMHRFIIVGYRESDNKPIYKEFISRRDPALDGPDGYDPLIDRFDVQPKARCIALAVELEPQWSTGSGRKTIVGFEVATRQFTNKDDETIEVPNVALVIESPHTLFSQVIALAEMGKEITEEVYAVKRNGGGTDTSYTLLPVGDAFELDEELDEFFEEFDFEAYLEELADEDRMKELIDPISDDAEVVRNFGGKKSKGKKDKSDKSEESKPARSTRTRRTRNEEPDAEPEEPEAAADEAPSEETPRRSRRFSDLKRERTRS